ncbi:MAG: hypothetical protein MZV64_22570 [Ignavibacteriales bacterium]|nr:hypothetical protein [Ignavibacteriales bacterium]
MAVILNSFSLRLSVSAVKIFFVSSQRRRVAKFILVNLTIEEINLASVPQQPPRILRLYFLFRSTIPRAQLAGESASRFSSVSSSSGLLLEALA